jgi:hypothetical protein
MNIVWGRLAVNGSDREIAKIGSKRRKTEASWSGATLPAPVGLASPTVL